MCIGIKEMQKNISAQAITYATLCFANETRHLSRSSVYYKRTQTRQNTLIRKLLGNVLSFYMVKHHPELLHAYYASNPVISQLASEKELLDTLLAHFKDNEELAKVKIPFEIDEDLF